MIFSETTCEVCNEQRKFVVGQWEGGGTHTGRSFEDFLAGGLPAATGRKMHFTGTTVLKVVDGKIMEELGLDDGVTALTQLGLIAASTSRGDDSVSK